MTKQVTIMTTEIMVGVTDDLSEKNEVFNFKEGVWPSDHVVAGASWTVKNVPSRDSLCMILRFIFGLFSKNIPEYDVWLLIGNSAWQPDTRVVRYRKLWGALKARGMVIPDSENSLEILMESNGKVKFFGATQFYEHAIEDVIKAIADERCAYIVAFPGHCGIRDVLEMGWSGDLNEDSKMLVSLQNKGALIFKKIGEFDDCEVGFLVLGNPELVRTLLN